MGTSGDVASFGEVRWSFEWNFALAELREGWPGYFTWPDHPTSLELAGTVLQPVG